MSVELNYKSRQVAPSEAFLNLCANQQYVHTTVEGGEAQKVEYYEGAGDARVYASCPIFETDKYGKARFITKASPVSNVANSGITYETPRFRYIHSPYRLKQVYLRYAEALNRCGYPRHAYMILRDGINSEKMPKLTQVIKYDDENKTKQLVFELDSAVAYNGADYVGIDELRRAQAEPEYMLFLDLTSKVWNNDGIHEQGCGPTDRLDSLTSYERVVAQRIQDEAMRAGALTPEVEAKVRALRAQIHADEAPETGEGETEEPNRDDYTEIPPVEPAEPDAYEINAVETLIADECALNLAYEGHRMFDLIRFARHKDFDQTGVFTPNYGTQWLAWKIARRQEKLAPYETPAQFNGGLFNLLLNSENSYLKAPVY